MRKKLIVKCLAVAMTLGVASFTMAKDMPKADGDALWHHISTLSPYTEWSYWPDHQGMQDGKLRKRLNIEKSAVKVANFITAATEEVKSIARICGKNALHKLDREDLAALDPELSRITNIQMA